MLFSILWLKQLNNQVLLQKHRHMKKKHHLFIQIKCLPVTVMCKSLQTRNENQDWPILNKRSLVLSSHFSRGWLLSASLTVHVYWIMLVHIFIILKMYITRFTNKVHFCNDFVLYCNFKKMSKSKTCGWFNVSWSKMYTCSYLFIFLRKS